MSLLLLFLPNPSGAPPVATVPSGVATPVPRIKPKPYPFGLMSVADSEQVEWGDRRLNGISWSQGVCSLGGLPNVPSCDPTDPIGIAPSGGTGKFDPVDSRFAVECSAFSQSDDSPEAIAEDSMRAVFQAMVEFEFQLGQVAQQYTTPNFYLNGPTTNVLSGTGVHPVAALGELIYNFRQCVPGDTGVVWATVAMVEQWMSFGLVHQVGDHLETISGAWVAATIAFNGSAGPAATPANTNWAYMTQRPKVWYTPTEIFVPEDLIRSENTRQATARRRWVMQLETCCAVAIPVNLCYPECESRT